MPGITLKKGKLDKDFFLEIQEKCTFLGISLTEKDFSKNPEIYLNAAKEYDERAKAYLYKERARFNELQKKFAAEENMPAYLSLGKARMELLNELNRQLAAERETAKQAAISEAEMPAQPDTSATIAKDTRSGSEKLLAAFAAYKDRTNGKPLLEQDARALLKKANFDYLERCLNELGINGRDANEFRMRLSRSHGTLSDFIGSLDSGTGHEKTAEALKQEENEKIRKEEIRREQEATANRLKEEADRTAAEKIRQAQIEQAEAARIAQETLQKQAEKRARAAEKEKIAQQQAEKKKKAAQEAQERRREETRRRREAQQAQLAARKAAKQREEERKAQQKAAKLQKNAERKAQKEAMRLAKAQQKARLKAEAQAKRDAIKAQRKAARQARRARFAAWIANIKKAFTPKKDNQQPLALKPRQKRRGLWSRLFARKRKKIETITLNIESYRAQQKEEKKAKIIEFKQKVRTKGKKVLKYAAIGAIPLGGIGGTAYLATHVEPIISLNDVRLKADSLPLSRDILQKAETYYASINDFANGAFATPTYDMSTPELNWMENLPKEPIDEADYNIAIPLIQNDVLHNAPNVDFFNYCFSKSNERYNRNDKYGISEAMYKNFKRNNSAVAQHYKIKSYQKLDFDDARVIAKTEIYDKYGLGYMQNRSMAAYLYNTLVQNQNNKNYVATIAQSVCDFYDANGKSLTEKQSDALFKLSLGVSIDVSDWRQMVAAINMTASDPALEEKLYETMQRSLLDAETPTPYSATNELAQRAYENSRFAYEPTIKAAASDNTNILSFADLPFFNELLSEHESRINSAEILRKQKDKDLETFSKIYMQCCYDNVLKLSYDRDTKRKTFKAADEALAHHGIYSKLHRDLYCAGMSMASFCQAADIFTEENPNSHVSTAIKELLVSCRNIHSCGTLKDDLGAYTQTVTKSANLMADVKSYMEKNDKAILFVWAPRGHGRYHHQTLFQPAEVASNDAYTYCAYNNNHWGNENTFAAYMGSRAKYGKGGYFADIGSSLDKLAEKSLQKELKQRETAKDIALQETKKFSFDNVTQYLNHSLLGR